jgi:hypothetical protein
VLQKNFRHNHLFPLPLTWSGDTGK